MGSGGGTKTDGWWDGEPFLRSLPDTKPIGTETEPVTVSLDGTKTQDTSRSLGKCPLSSPLQGLGKSVHL